MFKFVGTLLARGQRHILQVVNYQKYGTFKQLSRYMIDAVYPSLLSHEYESCVKKILFHWLHFLLSKQTSCSPVSSFEPLGRKERFYLKWIQTNVSIKVVVFCFFLIDGLHDIM